MNRSAVFALILAAACGDNLATPDAPVHSDGHTGSDAGSSVDAAPGPPIAAVVAGDFGAGNPGVLASVDLTSRAVTKGLAVAGSVGDDPALRHFGHELYVVNRSDGNNVTVLDDRTFAVQDQLATGASSNPQDVAVVGSKLYVPIYGGKGVAVLTRGTTTNTTIDLSVDDPDGKPECETAFAVGTDVYVACQLLNDTTFAPRGVGKIYVIDSATDTVRTKFDMKTKNPFGLFELLADGNLVVSTVDFTDNSGCIEKITVGAAPTSVCTATNTVLGGIATRVAVESPLLWLSIADATFSHQTLVSYNLATAAVHIESPAKEQIGDVDVCPNGDLVVAEVGSGSGSDGIRIYGGSGELTTAAAAIGLPPKAQHGIECY